MEGYVYDRIHFIIEMIRWTGLAPWEFEFPFTGSLTSTFLQVGGVWHHGGPCVRPLISEAYSLLLLVKNIS